ncbi:magnesium transporter [Mycolicibacterium conceptionense]|jgi:magnesium transporter|uniref:Magnesium transporter MgtE n=2 Tax=Mycolicibacterium TaxID=1866885 RepID=A0A0J8WNQ4_9MYCO|nr:MULTISPECIES: magnesium transporter [Mycolicibacterium]KLI10114.1 magnesium transporter [Mycolicibacterium senegalense]KLO53138.1 magnesium transporter [Mycolicibacterium senegalense]KMV14654.1 magnesium transporter [Mycolicibacterium conceptionense]ORV26808.1 magnesium transporter [Mycolicibacterium conceptionense]CQD23002.1 magnesium transporter [Mycolicibacterium conceptionense]
MSSTKAGAATISLREAVEMDTTKAIELWLEIESDPTERERQIAALSADARAKLGGLLDAHTGPELLTTIDAHLAAKVLKAAPVEAAAGVVSTLDAPHAAEILRRFDNPRRDSLLDAMVIDRARMLRGVLSWPEDSVAAHMQPDALTVAPTSTVAQAVDQIREHAAGRPHGSAGAYVYVVGTEGILLGAVRLRALVLTPADRPVEALMDDPVTVAPLTDVEDAAMTLIDHQLDELPVVDAENRLLGVLTEDDAVQVAEQEATEDAERQGGSAPLEVPYLQASPWLLWRKRIVWLLVLFAAEAYTGTVLRAFEEEMEAVVALAFFIPLLIGTGGNTGTQITTTLVRAMGTGQVRFRDVPAIVTKEMSTGALIAIAMAAAALVRSWTLGVGPQVTLTVCLTVAAIVMWASLVSSVLPLVLKKLKVDPAVVSAPMIATIVDGTGLMIYFWIAHLTLPQLAGL